MTYILSYGKKLPKHIRDKYFKRIRTLLIAQHIATNNRIKDDKRRNTRTKTYFRFSFKKIILYFGLYFPCHCGLPAPFVISNTRYVCHLHHKNIDFYYKVHWTKIPPEQRRERHKELMKRYIITGPPKNILNDYHEKYVHSERQGVSYRKEFSWYKGQFYKCKFGFRRREKPSAAQQRRYSRHSKTHREGYVLAFKHKILDPNIHICSHGKDLICSWCYKR